MVVRKSSSDIQLRECLCVCVCTTIPYMQAVQIYYKSFLSNFQLLLNPRTNDIVYWSTSDELDFCEGYRRRRLVVGVQ